MRSIKNSPFLRELITKTGLRNANPRVIAALCILVLLVIAVLGIRILNAAGQSGGLSFDAQAADDTETSTSDEFDLEVEEAKYIFVYVCGAVANPGVYHLSDGSRINDALQEAGGFTPDASTTAVNLAQSLVDGEQVYFPTVEEVQKGWTQSSQKSSSSGTNSSGLVNINTADESELDTLPGIGPSTAQKIISYREANGNFSSIEDIKNVSGIGDSKFAQIKDLIEV